MPRWDEKGSPPTFTVEQLTQIVVRVLIPPRELFEKEIGSAMPPDSKEQGHTDSYICARVISGGSTVSSSVKKHLDAFDWASLLNEEKMYEQRSRIVIVSVHQ